LLVLELLLLLLVLRSKDGLNLLGGVRQIVLELLDVREGLDQLLPEVHLELARGLAGDTLVCSAFCVSSCTFVPVKQVN
jgi:hypothetical protein